MKNYNLYQCDLEKPTGDGRLGSGRLRTTVFLPEKYAVVGKILEVKIGVLWSNGWVVKAVYKESKRTYEDIVKFENDYQHTREASDV